MFKHIYIFLTIAFTVYGQLVLKWQVSKYGSLPEGFSEKVVFVLLLLVNPWIISSLAAAFIASLTWMAAMSSFDISYAYPFMSLAFVAVLGLSYFLFNEQITAYKICGMVLIVAGIIVGSR